MTIIKTENGYKVDLRPRGTKGRRFIRLFKTRDQAARFEKKALADYGALEPWEEETKPDKRSLSELIETWFNLHGKSLKRGKQRKTYLENLSKDMGNPIASDITAGVFSDFRSNRLNKVSKNTVNHDLSYLKALFNELDRLGEWSRPNPFAKIRKLSHDETELAYLELDEIDTLLNELDQRKASHARISARICLETGARWTEAATLKASQVRNQRITFARTKSGKNRTVPIDPELERLILDHMPMVNGYSTLKRVVHAMNLDLPAGQLSHVLRHTFASHFMMNGGNILTLQRILGHASINMTMRYAHLSPDHLIEATRLNPIRHRT